MADNVQHIVIDRGDLAEVWVSATGEVSMVYRTRAFPSADMADAAYAELIVQNPGWPLERKDVCADQEGEFSG